MNGHRNQKQIGWNNHLQTLFCTHFYILSITTDFNEWSLNSDQWSSNSDEWSLNSDEWSSKSETNWSKQSPPTLFHYHSNILSNCNWFRWMVIKNISKLVETITSKHNFTLTPIFCRIGKVFSKIQSPPNTISHSFLYSVKLKMGSSKSNHLQTLYDTLQKTSSQTKPRRWQGKKDGLA